MLIKPDKLFYFQKLLYLVFSLLFYFLSINENIRGSDRGVLRGDKEKLFSCVKKIFLFKFIRNEF